MTASPADPQLEALVRRFSKLVRAVAARVGGAKGRQIAEDVEQVVFLSLWKQLEREQSIENPASYIYRCTVRETVRLLKADGPEEALDEAAELPDTQTATPDDRLAASERAASIAEALQALPLDRRRAAQAYLAGFSVQETMGMYGWTYQRARNLSTRGMAELRDELRKRGING